VTYQPKDMTGALFRNTRKTEDSYWPDYHGDLVVEGVKYRLAGWVKEGKRGKYLSLAAQLDLHADEERKPVAPAPTNADIPF
jgi:hypothetical protein